MKSKTTELIREQETTYEDIPSLKATVNDIKRDINQLEAKGVFIDTRPLTIDQNWISIEKWTKNEVDISNLPSSLRTIDCADHDWPVMASNSQYLLFDQYPNLCLVDRELTVVKQSPWGYDRISDMCWSSTLNSFIIITDKDGVFLVDENLISIEPIEVIEKRKWLSCTCSDAVLFLTTHGISSKIFQFNLLSSLELIKEWNTPNSCQSDEFIQNIAYNHGTLALVTQYDQNKLKIELRSSATLDRL